MTARLGRLGPKLVDGLQYAGILVGAVVVVVGGASLLLTGELVALKWFLFLAGLLSAGVGTLKLRPKPAWKDAQREGLKNDYTDRGYGAAVREWPPAAWLDYDRPEGLSDGARLLLLGVLALAASFALEAALSVGVPQVPGAG